MHIITYGETKQIMRKHSCDSGPCRKTTLTEVAALLSTDRPAREKKKASIRSAARPRPSKIRPVPLVRPWPT